MDVGAARDASETRRDRLLRLIDARPEPRDVGLEVGGVALRFFPSIRRVASVQPSEEGGGGVGVVGALGAVGGVEAVVVRVRIRIDRVDVDDALRELVPLTLHATARALVEHPGLNARVERDDIVLYDRIDIGIAVQTDAGLVVPVVRACERLSVEEIAREATRLADGARAGTLAAEELRDSTFTVTSAGKLGGLFVTPLINHPEVAILGLHRIAERPVVRDGEIVVRPVGNVSVSFDHRVVDGVRAAAFCLDVIDRLQSAGSRGV